MLTRSGRFFKLSGGERDRELAFWERGVTVYPIDRWVNLMPDRFGGLVWLGPIVSLVVVCRLVAEV